MLKPIILLLFLISILLTVSTAESQGRPFWDPALHGITQEAKQEFDQALAKGDYRRAEQIRQMVAQEVINAFWAGVNVRTLRPIMEDWNMDFKGK